MEKIGFIGLGIMGRPMAKNLIKAGYKLAVYDIVESAVKDLGNSGAEICGSIGEVAEQCATIITMLPNGPDVKKVVLESGGIIEHAKEGTLIIDMSSIAPGVSIKLYEKLKAKNIRIVDAPVSGGEPKAVDGSLAIMVGGDELDFEQAKPFFNRLGSTATLVGPIGSGNTCKLTNQVIVALNIAALSEGMMLAKMAGTDPERVFQAIRAGLAGSTVMDAKTPMMLEGNFNPGFKIDLHIKDLTNALNTGKEFNIPLPLTEEIIGVMKNLSKSGFGSKDHSGIALHYEGLTGMRLSE